MTYKIGFDIGSTTIKAVVLDENQQICYKSYERHKAQVRQKALEKIKIAHGGDSPETATPALTKIVSTYDWSK